MECIVHFTVMNEEGPKKLRGLIFVDKGKLPDSSQILEMFHDMEYKVAQDTDDELVFRPVDAGEKYKYIRVNELDMGKDKYTEDRNLKSIVTNLLPKGPTGL
ncbi:hypothetical protein SAMN05661091_5328 [Paenibacillus uliginis N3/975]|uniref:Uncharacterized protein n=1 Tax=Paenibacillus uliginis N3/975 TaxID=1313296 RepID=A0A1X7HR82_9BACL|nr:hypothetical protein [Paenibacillus uliginis]SMF91034.1 hypothetical protein SAMN05661091_5328 [Paenibacillus uliginis N3/975]